MRTIFQQIAMHAISTPEKSAILLPDRVITYRMLNDGVASVQRMLASLPLTREKPVAILIDNPARHLILILALMKSGIPSASLRPDQIREAMKHGISEALIEAPLDFIEGLRTHWVDDGWFMKQDGEIATFDHPTDRIIRLCMTSGSTGRPKLIGSTFQVFSRWVRDCYYTGIGASERVLCTLGMSSAPTFVFRVLSEGNTICFARTDESVRVISLFGISEVRGSIAHFRDIMEHAGKADADIRLRQIAPGGAQLSADMADELQRRLKCDIINSYSSTEVCYMAIARGDVVRMRRAKGNCFTPFSEIEIVNDDGVPLPRGKEGRIRVRSDAMAWPYAGNLVETEAVRGDGWFYNGDVGRIDDDGLLVVTGRVDEVINCGGAKFAPEIIEENIRRYPKLAGCAVVRMPNAEAWLATTTKQSVTLNEVHEWIARNLRGELRGIEIARIFSVAEIPVAPSGKIARDQLRQLLLSMS